MTVESLTGGASQPLGRDSPLTVVLVVVIVLIVLVASVAVIGLRASPSEHVICVAETRMGNVSAWYPYAFVAAPYNGSESGELVVWHNNTVDGVWHNLTSRFLTLATDGDVVLGDAEGGNWTVSTATNATVAGPGASYQCTSPLIATLGPPNGPASDGFGGGTVASGLRNDTGLPTSFNASAACEQFGAPPSCAVSSTFELDFTASNGLVNTCGRADPIVMDLFGQELAAKVPFFWNGTSHLVPIGPSTSTGMFGWFNYTFPANGGVWQYQELPGIAGASSGLVFSYAGCPA